MGTSFHFGAGNSSLRETDEIFVAPRTTLFGIESLQIQKIFKLYSKAFCQHGKIVREHYIGHPDQPPS